MKSYVALNLFKNISAKHKKQTINISLVQEDKGVIGMLPVFKSKKEAHKVFGKAVNLTTINY